MGDVAGVCFDGRAPEAEPAPPSAFRAEADLDVDQASRFAGESAEEGGLDAGGELGVAEAAFLDELLLGGAILLVGFVLLVAEAE